MHWARLAFLALLLSQAATAQAQFTHGWASAETLLWWVKDGPAPPALATTAPTNSTPVYAYGSTANPDTTVLLGGQNITQPMSVGGRFTLGTWLAPAESVGVEGNYLFLGKSITSNTVASDGSSFGLYNPLIDVSNAPSTPTANILVQPGVANHGSATLITSHELQGGEINAIYALARGSAGYLTLIGGYRTLYLDESLSLSTTQFNDGATTYTVPGEFCLTTDLFNTRNYFNGGQLGLRGQWNRGNWFFGGTVKAALGNTREVLHVRGMTTTNGANYFTTLVPAQTVNGGIYAQPTNIGNYYRDRFAVLPEVSVRFGRQITEHLQLFVGYDFLYLSSVARPGNQISSTINANQAVSLTGLPQQPAVGAQEPAPLFVDTSYWAQGVNLGAQFVW